MNIDEMLTLEEMMELFNVNEEMAIAIMKSYRLDDHMIGRTWMVPYYSDYIREKKKKELRQRFGRE